MQFTPPLQSGYLIKRYKRFLADIRLPSNEITTIHCANTGKMTGCATPNDKVYFSSHDNPKRKYPYSWELTLTQNNDFICVNTNQANKLAVEAIKEERIVELADYKSLQTEVKYGGENSRIDILLTEHQSNCDNESDLTHCYVEVKSVTLLDENNKGQGYFPDTTTLRGQKHLRELIKMRQLGHRSVLLFAVLHTGIEKVSPAHHIDPSYASLLEKAIDFGVEVLAYKAEINFQSMELTTKLPFDIHHENE